MNNVLAPGGMPGLATLLAGNAQQFGDHIALRIDEDTITWRDLAELVQRLAQVLGPSVQAGERVGLWMHNCVEWAALFIAINLLGGVSVPISTRLTPEELEVIMRDAGAHVLLTSKSYRGRHYFEQAADRLAGAASGVLVLAPPPRGVGQWGRAGTLSGPAKDGNGLEAGLLCIQYTSGTTSTPKGVLLTTEAYLRTAAYVARCQRLTPSSRFISAGPFFHCSGSMHALTTCLWAGCTLTSMSIWNPEHFLDLVQRHRCDVAHMIYLRDVLALKDRHAREKLQTLQIAHDLGTREYLLRLHDELGIPGISNIYGMTETCGQFTMWYPDDPLELRISSNGRPQPGNHLRICDPASGEPLGPGAIGEIQMRGPTVTRGYFDRPGADAEAFTADGWLRSGDIGALSEQGVVTYMARTKEIIRCGGENFAPAEVEHVMHDHCRLGQVCVLGLADERLGEVPAAVVLDTLVVNWDKVYSEMRQRLAGFKVPKAIYATAAFPTTMTNKVQRSTLKEWIDHGKLKRLF
ncbi:class I adenylate-forming enzyme family protein [Bordetella sp. BOR01]|uniref:class I adenylate-forming enzyme family protein n=1 Tax=Bordetella sp. BOR01 TaxID=2854779 RepID=UPI001C4841F0|nr:class I adenylate-forming enzyme family protein [Bordetella sp. BOR01]MBV7482949.1 acyl--CoA ligase [Bordetella sp. BOR01]